MIEPTTVAIVGARPTGLLLAGDLSHAGVDVTVLERRATESNLTRAFGVHARTLEHLDAPWDCPTRSSPAVRRSSGYACSTTCGSTYRSCRQDFRTS
jgi:flavin-dependent dehydrogenase